MLSLVQDAMNPLALLRNMYKLIFPSTKYEDHSRVEGIPIMSPSRVAGLEIGTGTIRIAGKLASNDNDRKFSF